MPLFKHLTYKEVIRVLNLTSVVEVGSGETIFREREPGEELFVILSGRVRLHKDGLALVALGKGAHFGEMALVDRATRSATATAEEPTRLLALRRRDFYEILRKESPLAVKLLWSFVQVLTERLRKTTAELSAGRAEQQTASSSSIPGEDEFQP